MTDETVVLRIDRAERAQIDQGIFVRLDLPRPIPLAVGGIASTVLVGRVDGSLRAYANVCRHTAIPLDARGGTSLGVMTEDGANLFCDSHGAVYRPEDGLCIMGPCAGTHLIAFAVEEDTDPECLRITPTSG
jgi:nitrite reductase/ring-hydroxylating ferredoxin subunit